MRRIAHLHQGEERLEVVHLAGVYQLLRHHADGTTEREDLLGAEAAMCVLSLRVDKHQVEGAFAPDQLIKFWTKRLGLHVGLHATELERQALEILVRVVKIGYRQLGEETMMPGEPSYTPGERRRRNELVLAAVRAEQLIPEDELEEASAKEREVSTLVDLLETALHGLAENKEEVWGSDHPFTLTFNEACVAILVGWIECWYPADKTIPSKIFLSDFCDEGVEGLREAMEAAKPKDWNSAIEQLWARRP